MNGGFAALLQSCHTWEMHDDTMPGALTFAQLSDPHLPLAPGLPSPVRLLRAKRLLGLLSWRRNRSKRHGAEVLQALCSDIAAHRLDHILVTGDLVNIALPEEFAAGRDWLAGLGAPEDVTVIPGNHDSLVSMPWREGIGIWEPWMTGDAGQTGFPFVRVRGPVAFVCLSSAVPTPPLIASGRLGADQVARLRRVLDELGRAGLFRVVAIHHPPESGVVTPRKGLSDHAEFQEALASAGAELVLHGHCHHSHLGYLPGPLGPVPVIGVPSASARRAADGRHARWHLFRVSRCGAEHVWRVSMTVRGLGPAGDILTEGGWTAMLPFATEAMHNGHGTRDGWRDVGGTRAATISGG